MLEAVVEILEEIISTIGNLYGESKNIYNILGLI